MQDTCNMSNNPQNAVINEANPSERTETNGGVVEIVKRRNATTNNHDRERVINSYLQGNSAKTIALIMQIKVTTIHEIIRKYQNTGLIVASVRGGTRSPKLTNEQKETMLSWVNENCTVTLSALKAKIQDIFNITVSTSTISRYIEKFHYSLKRVTIIPERRNDADNIVARKIYALRYISLSEIFSENEIIFIDEVGFKVSTRVSRGRSAVGKPAVSIVPKIRTRNISICCAMSRQGIMEYVVSPVAFNTQTFINFLSLLIGRLRSIYHFSNAIFIMDNVPFHKSNQIKNYISDQELSYDYLPPYSPFLNPIENMFSKWKEFTKRCNPQNENELMEAIEDGRNLISQVDCEGYFRNMARYISRSINEDIIND